MQDLLQELDKGRDFQKHVMCVCGSLIKEASNIESCYSGVVNYPLVLCNDCRSHIVGLSRIICLKCKSFVSAHAPGRDNVGFVFEPNKCYHIATCPSCTPDKLVTPILEHVAYCRERNIPTDADQDMVQEIEQKREEGLKEAERVDKIIMKLDDNN